MHTPSTNAQRFTYFLRIYYLVKLLRVVCNKTLLNFLRFHLQNILPGMSYNVVASELNKLRSGLINHGEDNFFALHYFGCFVLKIFQYLVKWRDGTAVAANAVAYLGEVSTVCFIVMHSFS